MPLDEVTLDHTGPEVRETHTGLVFLVGDRAYKVKKPVDTGRPARGVGRPHGGDRHPPARCP